MNNPIEIFYCWQALVTALLVYMITHAIKAAIPLVYEPKTEKGKIFLKRVLLPAVPPILGFLGGAFIPLHPEVLDTYVRENVHSWPQTVFVFGAWGASVGQFADYLYTKVTKLIMDLRPETPEA